MDCPIRRELTEGVADPELAPDGLAQAVLLGKYLAPEHLDAVYASSLRRARQTAEPVVAGRGFELRIEPDVAEYDKDSPEYVPVEELKASNDPRWQAMLDGTMDGMEDHETFATRSIAGVNRIIDAHRGHRVAVVCHGGVINAYLSHILGLDPGQPRLLLPQLHLHPSRRGSIERRTFGRHRQRDHTPPRERAPDGPVPEGLTMLPANLTEPDVTDLIDFLDRSPSPWHAVQSTSSTRRIRSARRTRRMGRHPDPRLRRSRRGDHRLVDPRRGEPRTTGFRIGGAHTDSPCLRIKPRPDTNNAGWKQLGVEVYGGILNNTWLDRDLGVAGRVVSRGGEQTLVNVAQPIARVSAACRPPRSGCERRTVSCSIASSTSRPCGASACSSPGEFASWIGERAGLDEAPAWWDLCLYDVQGAAVVGADSSMLTSARLDNQLSCWAATRALVEQRSVRSRRRDRAERSRGGRLGEPHRRARTVPGDGVATPRRRTRRFPRRLAPCARPTRRVCRRTTLMRSTRTIWSATSPNTFRSSTPDRRSRSTPTSAMPRRPRRRRSSSARARPPACRGRCSCHATTCRAGPPSGRSRRRRLGIDTVDVGVPQLSMHSARELCGVDDPLHLAAALGAFFS